MDDGTFATENKGDEDSDDAEEGEGERKGKGKGGWERERERTEKNGITLMILSTPPYKTRLHCIIEIVLVRASKSSKNCRLLRTRRQL